jgi:hypothetical protein
MSSIVNFIANFGMCGSLLKSGTDFKDMELFLVSGILIFTPNSHSLFAVGIDFLENFVLFL